MERSWSISIGLLLFCAPVLAQSERVGVDPRVELMGIIFRLSGDPQYTQGRIPSYNAAIDSHFARFRDHEAIRMAHRLREKYGVSYDAVVNIAVHVSDIESMAERVPFDRDPSLKSRWHGEAREFLKAARKFVKDSDFAGFLESQRQLFATTDTRLRAFVTQNADLPWFDKFFGPHRHVPFVVVPVLTSGGGNYGANVKLDSGMQEDYAFLCACAVDAEGLPVFNSGFTPLLVHEFAHTYVHPLIDKFEPELRPSGNRLFAAEAEEMTRSAYGNGNIVLNESLVRAVTARYILEHQGEQAAHRDVAAERRNGFLWTGDLLAVINKYAADREHYPTMDSFMPQIVDCFHDAASHVDEMVRSRKLPAIPAGLKFATPFRDDFDGHLDPGWQWIDPKGDSTRTIDARKGFLRIAVRGYHDLWTSSGNFTAPRLMRQADGDFILETKLAGPARWCGGLLVWKDEDNFVRLDRGIHFQNEIGLEAAIDGGYAIVAHDYVVADPLWLRLQRAGSAYTASYSLDGINWVPLKRIYTAIPINLSNALPDAVSLLKEEDFIFRSAPTSVEMRAPGPFLVGIDGMSIYSRGVPDTTTDYYYFAIK